MIVPQQSPHAMPGPSDPPPRAEDRDKSRFRAAAAYARHVLPPAVAELIAREMDAAATFGYLVGPNHALSMRVANEVLKLTRPKTDTD